VLVPLFRGAARCALLPLPPRTREDAGYAFGEVVEALGMIRGCHQQSRTGREIELFSKVTDHGSLVSSSLEWWHEIELGVGRAIEASDTTRRPEVGMGVSVEPEMGVVKGVGGEELS